MKFVIALLLISLSLFCNAQLKRDSLIVAFHNPVLSDSVRLDALQKVAFNIFISKNTDSTIFYSQILLDTAIAWGNKKFEADALNNIGLANHIQGRQDKAIGYFDKSLQLSKEIDYLAGQANVYGNLGVLYRHRGEYEQALENYALCYEINEQRGSKVGMSKTINNMANIFYLTGDYNKALQYNIRSLYLKTELNDKRGMSGSLNNIGQIYFVYEDYDKALDYFSRSLELANAVNDKMAIVNTSSNIGNIYYKQEKYKEAYDIHWKALTLVREVGDKYGIALGLYNIANDEYKLDHLDSAIAYSDRALLLAQEIGSPEIIRTIQRFRMTVFYYTNRFDEAEIAAAALMDILDRGVRLNFPLLSENEQDLYNKTLQLDYCYFNAYAVRNCRQNPAYAGKIYNNLLKTKGLLLKSSTALRAAILSSSDTTLKEKYDEWIDLREQLVKGYNNGDSIADLEEKANVLERDLIRQSEIFSAYNLGAETTWKDVQVQLKPGEAAIEHLFFNDIFVASDHYIYCALIVTPDCEYPYVVELCSDDELTEVLGKIQGTNFDHVNKIYGTRQVKNHELYKLTWKPMEKYLDNIHTVYLSPAGALHRISFPALSNENNVLLCENYNIRIKSSTSRICDLKNFELNQKSEVVLFGGINYSVQKEEKEIWTYLEGTKNEADNLEQLMLRKKYRVKTYSGDLASETSFKSIASDANVLHVATHGFFYPDPQKALALMDSDTLSGQELTFRSGTIAYNRIVSNTNPLMRSGLVFAGANTMWNLAESNTENSDDGVLTAQEVVTLDLRKTGLVVLSACESGLGDISTSEGVYGLQRAFKIAGVQYIIMSLWKVPDKETAEFMVCFYNYLIKAGEPQEAFEKTQITMMKKYDPYYWAAFVLVE